jgi:hypothetical protein
VFVRPARGLSLVILVVSFGCGRTPLWHIGNDDGENGGTAGMPPVDECAIDTDCALPDPCVRTFCRAESDVSARLVCVAEVVVCEDGDACSRDFCNPQTGVCEHERPTDADGDGFIGTAPPDTPAGCGGDDCNDQNPAIHPLSPERCDGLDENCNGIIDDGARYSPLSEPVKLAPELLRSAHGGIVFDGQSYGVSYADKSDLGHTVSYFTLLDASGNRTNDPKPVSLINADTYAGAVSHSGDSFLTTWSDARQAGNYEIYATRFNEAGEEVQADLRLTNAPDYSLRPLVQWTGTEYLVVWEDYRTEDADGKVRVFGRRVSKGGALLDDERELSSTDASGEYPSFALGKERVAVVYTTLDPITDVSRVMARTVSFELGNASPPTELAQGQEPVVVWLGDRFLVAWHTGSVGAWGSAIAGALLYEDGSSTLLGALTTGDRFARWKTLVSLGDRAVLVWSGAGDDGNYDLSFVLLDANGAELQSRQRLTNSPQATVDPLATIGPNGEIAVLFDENQLPALDAYYLRLGCQIPSLR